MQLKLVQGETAGTVTAYYLSSLGPKWDEIDFGFLGNSSGNPYTLPTNVFTQGKGHREQQFHLWFDPTKNFHTYSVAWHPRTIIFLVDDTPIRVFKNLEKFGVPFPDKEPMRIYSSLWNADDWATQGGRVETDWSKSPFVAHYMSFRSYPHSTSCRHRLTPIVLGLLPSKDGLHLNSWGYRKLRWVQRYYRIYNSWTDHKHFPNGLPTECKH